MNIGQARFAHLDTRLHTGDTTSRKGAAAMVTHIAPDPSS